MRIQGRTLADNADTIPEAQRDELGRLGSAMWKQVAALKLEVQAREAALADTAYLAFKGKLLSKPKRARRVTKQVA